MNISVLGRVREVRLTKNNKKTNIITTKFGLERNKYFLFSSLLVPEKGAHYLISAYNLIKTEKMLVIEGANNINEIYVKQLKELASNNPNIIFTGIVEDRVRSELYKNAYIYVLPSDKEDIPCKLLEALNYAKTAITSDLVQNINIIKNYGLTFRRGNILDLSDKLKRSELIEQNIEELGFKAKESIQNIKRIG